MNSVTQIDFRGGMNLYHLDHSIAENEYSKGFNIRVRDNSVSCIKAPEEDTTAPNGTKQGIGGFDEYLILANAGRLYYKDTTNPNASWTIIPGVVLNPQATEVFMEPVPATPKMLRRKFTGSNIIGISDPTVTIENDITVDGQVSGVVVQDGQSQPQFVYKYGNGLIGRRLKKYSEWSQDNREYVPVGRQMAYVNGILFIVSAGKEYGADASLHSGKEIYRSNSVSPLDFVVNIKANGDKGGDASTTSHCASPHTITALKGLSTGELFVGTTEKCYPLTLDFERTVFQEPTFKNQRSFNAGVVGQNSFLEILGDNVFIDTDGIRSYNAVSNIANEGRNSILSLKVAQLLAGYKQSSVSAATVFDNYAFFSVTSSYGDVVLVYDQLAQIWVSIDRYGIGAIKQFASTKLSTDPSLYVITDKKVYKLFGSSSYLSGSIYLRSSYAGDAKVGLKLNIARVVFDNLITDTSVSFTELYNTGAGKTITETIAAQTGSINYPAIFPVAFRAGENCKSHMFPFDGLSHDAFKVGGLISWQGAAKLIMTQLEFNKSVYTATLSQQAKAYAS